MALPQRKSVRRIVPRVIALAAGAVVLNYIIAWLAAGAMSWANPPTGNVRASWVASLDQTRSTPQEEKHLRSPTGVFMAYGGTGVLAQGTSLMWSRMSFDANDDSSVSIPISHLEDLPEIIEPRYRAEFRRWADELNPDPGAPTAIFAELSLGFPLHSLGYSFRYDYTSGITGGARSYQPVFAINGGIDASRLTSYRTPQPALILPLIPRWPEFLINTAFWGGVLWLIFGGAAMLRGAWRTQHGRCAKCGYDRCGLVLGSPCPECGIASKISSPSPA